MIYSVSGTQGCGKTTILKTLKSMGHNVIKRKTSRSVLKDWNISLDLVYKDQTLMMDFQEEIIKRKFDDEKDYSNSTDVWFTDRSYIDLLIYSTIIIGHNNKNSDWLDSYFNKCKTYQKTYQKIFYISPLPFVISDGVRTSNEVFNYMVDYSIKGYLTRLNRSNLVEINSISNTERVNKILQNL